MDDKIKVFIDEESIINNFKVKSVNNVFINALNFMYINWPELIEINIYNHENKKYPFPVTFLKKEELPSEINKSYLLITNNFNDLVSWEKLYGKSLAYNVIQPPKEHWHGFKMISSMSEDEFIQVFRKTMHLYS